MVRQNLSQSKKVRAVITFGEYAVLAVIFIIFFGDTIKTDSLLGDAGDAMYCDLICEYWFQFFSGDRGFNDLCTFYPVSDTLGYSDLQLGFGLIYSAFRFIGFDIFLAGKYSMLLVFFVGLLSFFSLLRRSFRFGFIPSAVGSLTALFSSAVLYSFSHMQMMFVVLYPIFFLLLSIFKNNLGCSTRDKICRIMAGTSIVAFIGLMFFTSFYGGYFLFITAVFLAASYLVFSRKIDRRPWKTFRSFVQKHRIESIWYVLANAFWIAPFLHIYLPVLEEFGARDIGGMLVHSPVFFEIIHDTGSSPLSAFINSLFGFEAGTGETFYGFNVLHFLIFCLAAVVALRSFIFTPPQVAKNDARNYLNATIWVPCVICSMVAITLLITKFETFSLWTTLMQIVPGASTIRAIGRFMMVVVLLSGFVIAYAVETTSRPFPKSSTLSAILLSVIILQQAYSAIPLKWSHSEYEAFAKNASDIPEQCEIILIDYNEENGGVTPTSQQKAWLLASESGRYTINGNSGQVPKGWSLFFSDREQYYETIANWINHYKIDEAKVFIFNESESRWIAWNSL